MSMPGYAGAFARAVDEPAFSNSDEGYAWMDNWCARCVNDGYGLGLDEPQCPLIMVALCGRTPAEWFPQGDEHAGWRLGDQYHCVMFRDRDDPGDREPEPAPDPPGQLTLLPREPYEGTRMYADTKPQAPATGVARAVTGRQRRQGGTGGAACT